MPEMNEFYRWRKEIRVLQSVKWKDCSSVLLENYKLKIIRLMGTSPLMPFKDFDFWFEELKQMKIDIEENLKQQKINPFGELSADDISNLALIPVFRKYSKRIKLDSSFRQELEEGFRLRILGYKEVIAV